MRRIFDEKVPQRSGLGWIGAGAFGAFAIPHLAPFFDLAVHDPRPDIDELAPAWGARSVDLATAANCRIVVLSVPLDRPDGVARSIALHLRQRAWVIETCSVKMRPLAVLRAALPAHVRIVGTHPLFGPQSGRCGIAGMQIAICPGDPGHRAVARFVKRLLALDVVRLDAEAHDRQMAHVQGLSHLVARGLKAMGQPDHALATAASRRLAELVALLGADSDELFQAIVGSNPFAEPVLRRFLATAESLVARATSA